MGGQSPYHLQEWRHHSQDLPILGCGHPWPELRWYDPGLVDGVTGCPGVVACLRPQPHRCRPNSGAELKSMADRVLKVRGLLRKGLEAKGAPGTWNHITDQIGMFSFTGLKPAECERLMSVHHIYLLKSGRISLAGLNKGNVQYMVDSVDEVIRECSK